MTQITLRGLDPRLQRELRAIARRHGISLNKAALRVLAKGAGLSEPKETNRIGHSLDAWIGNWSQQEADALLESIESVEQVDRALWE
jgi:hypothetical protein